MTTSKSVCVLVMIGAVALSAAGQADRLVSRMRSGDLVSRVAAGAEFARAVDGDARILNAEGAQDAVAALLEDADAELYRLFEERVNQEKQYGEGFAENHSMVLGVALRYLDAVTSPPDSRLLAAMVSSIYNPDSAFARKLAQVGAPVLDLALVLRTSARTEPQRWNAYGLLGFTLKEDTAGTLKSRLSLANRQSAIRALVSGLQESSRACVLEAVRALERAEPTEALGPLRELERRLQAASPPPSREADRFVTNEIRRVIIALEAKSVRR